MAASHVEGHAHKELDALVTNLVECGHFLAETANVVTGPYLSHNHVDTAVPVTTGGGEGRGGERGGGGDGGGGGEW